MLTGLVEYKNITFTFVVENDELHLIPPDDKRKEIEYEWKMKPLGNGGYTAADPIVMDEDFLIGRSNESGKKVVFIPKKGSWITFEKHVVVVKIDAFIEMQHNAEYITKAEFCCPEINYIYPVNAGISYQVDMKGNETRGVIGIETSDYDYTTSTEQQFSAFGKDFSMCYGISRLLSFEITETPLSLSSSLTVKFDETNDYRLIFELARLVRKYICFLSRRKNIVIPKVILSAPYRENIHLQIGTMYIVSDNGEPEEEPVKRGCYIKQEYIEGKEGQILSDIANGTLYMRHLPESYMKSKHMDESRFVMITAAFEWEFRRLFKEGIAHKSATIKAEEAVIKTLQTQVDKSSSKERAIYRRLISNVHFDSLSAKIIYATKELADTIAVFGEHLYAINHQILNISDMGERLSKQRNDFAHGNLENSINGVAALDLMYLERIIYAMQLKYYGVEKLNIQKAINDLFHAGLAIGSNS